MRKKMIAKGKGRKVDEFANFSEMWWWLKEHPMVHHEMTPPSRLLQQSLFHECLDIDFQMVNPVTNSIEKTGNTKLQCWLEFGPVYFEKELGEWRPCHDYHLDSGADTFEEAIYKLVYRVLKRYGDYKVLPLSKADKAYVKGVSARLFGARADERAPSAGSGGHPSAAGRAPSGGRTAPPSKTKGRDAGGRR